MPTHVRVTHVIIGCQRVWFNEVMDVGLRELNYLGVEPQGG